MPQKQRQVGGILCNHLSITIPYPKCNVAEWFHYSYHGPKDLAMGLKVAKKLRLSCEVFIITVHIQHKAWPRKPTRKLTLREVPSPTWPWASYFGLQPVDQWKYCGFINFPGPFWDTLEGDQGRQVEIYTSTKYCPRIIGTIRTFWFDLTTKISQGMVDGSASKPALRQDTGYMVEKPYLDIAPYFGAFGAYLMPQ